MAGFALALEQEHKNRKRQLKSTVLVVPGTCTPPAGSMASLLFVCLFCSHSSQTKSISAIVALPGFCNVITA